MEKERKINYYEDVISRVGLIQPVENLREVIDDTFPVSQYRSLGQRIRDAAQHGVEPDMTSTDVGYDETFEPESESGRDFSNFKVDPYSNPTTDPLLEAGRSIASSVVDFEKKLADANASNASGTSQS